MKKLVFLGILAGWLVFLIWPVLAENKSDDSVNAELLATAENYINHNSLSVEKNSPELRQFFQSVEKGIEKAGWAELDSLHLFLEKSRREIEEKSRELAFVYVQAVYDEGSRKEICHPICPPDFQAESSPELKKVFDEWQFQQVSRVWRVFDVIRLVKIKTTELEKKSEAEKIRNSHLLSFVLEIKSTDSDEEVLAKKYNHQNLRRR